jgi:hypothetical protein
MAHKVTNEIWLNRNVQNARNVLLEYGVEDEEYVLQELRTLLAEHGFILTSQQTTAVRNQLVIEGFLEEV